MLLLTVKEHAAQRGQPAAYIDIETHRDNPYPDVLIQLLVTLTATLEDNLKALKLKGGLRLWGRRRGARKQLRALRARLDVLLKEPQQAIHQLSWSNARRARRGGDATAAGGIAPTPGAQLGAGVGVSASSSAETTSARAAEYTRTKLDGLRAEAVEFRKVLQAAVEASGGVGVIVILDDFYFIRREHQPDVLSYLQQVVKNLNIWLKVGAVEHRLNEFEDGDPPRGLQMTQDAAKVPMDNTLVDFSDTKSFLEAILADICDQAGVSLERLLTETARTRLLIASGGVPRDYLNLVLAALGKATKRPGEVNRPRNKITAEDINVVAPDFLRKKEEDLRVDSRPEDVDRLRDRLNDVITFCLSLRQVNVFLVETRYLREQQWGRDISALSDLRFFHRIGTPTVKSSEPSYVGKRYEAFALDLSSYAQTRVRTKEVQFWTTDGFQKLRAASHVYTPDATRGMETTQQNGTGSRRAAKGTPASLLETNQITLFEQVGEPQATGQGPEAGEEQES